MHKGPVRVEDDTGQENGNTEIEHRRTSNTTRQRTISIVQHQTKRTKNNVMH